MHPGLDVRGFDAIRPPGGREGPLLADGLLRLGLCVSHDLFVGRQPILRNVHEFLQLPLSDIGRLLQLILHVLGRVVDVRDTFLDLVDVFAQFSDGLILGQRVACPTLLFVGLERDPFLPDALICQPLDLTDLRAAPFQALIHAVIGVLCLLCRANGVVEGRDLSLQRRRIVP